MNHLKNLKQFFFISILIIFINESHNSLLSAQQITSQQNYGFLSFATQGVVDSFYVVINNNYEKIITLPQNGRILLPIGKQEITLIKRNYDDQHFEVDIKANKLLKYPVTLNHTISKINPNINNSYYWLKNKININILTDIESEIYIDGKWIALGSLKLDLPLGIHTIQTRHKSGVTTKTKIDITSKKYIILDMYNQPLKKQAKLWGFLPGSSQIYKKQKIKGATFSLITVVSLSSAFYSHLQFTKTNNSYMKMKKNYIYDLSSESGGIYPNVHSTYILGEKTQKKYNEAVNLSKTRDISLYIALGMYCISFIDAQLSTPKAGYRNQNPKNIKTNVSFDISNEQFSLNLALKF